MLDSSTFTYLAGKTMGEVFEGVREGCYLYSRHTNPFNFLSRSSWHKWSIRKDQYIILFWNGSHNTPTILQLCNSGDEIISSRTIYGGTYALYEELFTKI